MTNPEPETKCLQRQGHQLWVNIIQLPTALGQNLQGGSLSSLSTQQGCRRKNPLCTKNSAAVLFLDQHIDLECQCTVKFVDTTDLEDKTNNNKATLTNQS